MGHAGFTLDDGVRRHLVEHDSPGNVRELKNVAYRLVLDLPADPGLAAMPADIGLAERLQRFEATIIRDTLRQTRGGIGATMARLGLPRKTLYDKMRRLGIDPRAYRGRSEEHTSELQSLMRISYAVFCLQKKHTARNTRSH